ncbi:hypothetical protein [Terribacillus sp. JSM ZJ617]|uniref:hypothetical protein n=1 Tax=Terribacillus sp. JSM ZJ617 TaxID=3342119 RepID=UPI0035A8C9A8
MNKMRRNIFAVVILLLIVSITIFSFSFLNSCSNFLKSDLIPVKEAESIEVVNNGTTVSTLTNETEIKDVLTDINQCNRKNAVVMSFEDTGISMIVQADKEYKIAVVGQNEDEVSLLLDDNLIETSIKQDLLEPE